MRVASSEQRLLQALRDRLGSETRLSITHEAPQTETPAQRQAREKAERLGQAERSIQDDPMVQGLAESFGARVIPESIDPLED